MTTFVANTNLTVINCDCGGVYAISEKWRGQAEKLGNFKHSWKCPYCRTERGYGEGTIDDLKKEVDKLRREKDWAKQDAKDAHNEADHFRRSRDGMKGALVKTKKRICNGVCPCCNRHFKNLESHMKNKHPKYVES